MPNEGAAAEERASHVGWIAAGIVLVLTFAAAATLWFIFHP
jgi:hypothetical protein